MWSAILYADRNGGTHYRRRAAHASISGIDAVSVYCSLLVTATLDHPAGTGRQRSNIFDPAGEYAWLPGVDLPLQRRRVLPKLAAEFINACRGDVAMVTDTYVPVGKLVLMMWGARQMCLEVCLVWRSIKPGGLLPAQTRNESRHIIETKRPYLAVA